jgi:voltage-gated sodium channel
MKQTAKSILRLKFFDNFVTLLILLNSILIGVELDYQHDLISLTQQLILWLFTLEIAIRWLGKTSVEEYLKNGWNWFDIFLVGIAYVPEGWIEHVEIMMAFRVLRVFRVIRLLKAFPELQLIANVLFRSIKSLFYICSLVLLTVYLYSVVGVILFRGKSEVITGIGSVKDPFGSVPEAMFSMFRVLTGEDWTDLRYDLLTHDSVLYDGVITFFFLSFFILSAFLLINIVVGAVVNNYDQVVGEESTKQEADQALSIDQLDAKLGLITKKLDSILERKDNPRDDKWS